MTGIFPPISTIVATVIIFILSHCAFSVPCCFAAVAKDVLVILRYDDVSGRSNTRLEQNIIRALAERRMSCTFAVIPHVCDRNYLDTGTQGFIDLTPEKAAILSDAMKIGTLEVALHGYTHQTIRDRNNGGYSEFSGLNYQNQETKIYQGKKLLEMMLGDRITTFVPPFNNYDATTLMVLEQLDFKCLSASSSGAAGEPSGLKYLPATCELPQLRAAVDAALHARDDRPIISVLFHEYDFIEADGKRGKFSFAEFLRLLDWLASQKDIRVISVGQATGLIKDLSPRRYTDNKAYRGAYTLIPTFVGRPTGVYLTSEAAVTAKNRLWALVIAFYSAGFCAACYAGFWIGGRNFVGLRLLRSCLVVAAVCSIFLVALYVLQLKSPGYKGVILLAALLGGDIGACAAYFRRSNKIWRGEGGKTEDSGQSGIPGQESP